MTSITLTAPAKVNIFLKVLNKRKDGYHNILTLFERISLADEIKISRSLRGIILSSDKFITRSPGDNIAYKAAGLILKYMQGPGSRVQGPGQGRGKRREKGVEITIKKRIPIAAGLGGGSSDAATTLMGINKLFGLKLKKAELMKLAKELGADVPFFILNKPFALGKARGDNLNNVDFRIRPWHLIIYPGNLKMSTKDIYETFDLEKGLAPRQGSGSSPGLLPKDLTRGRAGDKINLPLRHAMDLGEFKSMLYNDLQDTVIAKERMIGRVIKRLASSLDNKAIVSGSGPSVFCLYRTRREAIGAKEKLLASVPAAERKSWQVFVAGTQG